LVSSSKVGQATMAALTALQNFTPEQQVAAAGALLVCLHRKYGFNVSDSLTVSRNVLDRAKDGAAELRALNQYVEGEL
jgi:hypothetical protein